jgi:hypothetical protein
MKTRIRWRRYTKYLGGLICFFAGIHIGNAYVTGYWRFDPFNVGWDTVGRGIILLIIGLLFINWSEQKR